MLELSEAIRDYHDHTGLPSMVGASYGTTFFELCSVLSVEVVSALECESGWTVMLWIPIRTNAGFIGLDSVSSVALLIIYVHVF